MRLYKRTLIPATAFFVLGCLLSALLPISGANWQEVLTISENIESIQWPPSHPPRSPAGTTLLITGSASGFLEDQEGTTVFGVRGEICVKNEGEEPTEGLTILDTVQFEDGSGQFQDYVSATVDVSKKPILEPGQEHCYPYEVTFAPIEVEEVKYRNTVNVAILNFFGWLQGDSQCEVPDPCLFGPKSEADFTLPEIANPLIESPVEGSTWTAIPTTELPTDVATQIIEATSESTSTPIPTKTGTVIPEPSPTVEPISTPLPTTTGTAIPEPSPTVEPTSTSITTSDNS